MAVMFGKLEQFDMATGDTVGTIISPPNQFTG